MIITLYFASICMLLFLYVYVRRNRTCRVLNKLPAQRLVTMQGRVIEHHAKAHACPPGYLHQNTWIILDGWQNTLGSGRTESEAWADASMKLRGHQQ